MALNFNTPKRFSTRNGIRSVRVTPARRATGEKVLKDRRSQRRRGRMGSSVRRRRRSETAGDDARETRGDWSTDVRRFGR
eukprot:31120-Pelagococcus_subviridis.AAC.7